MPDIDNRFPSPGVDTRFPFPGTDTRFPSLGVDTRFPSPGVDARFMSSVSPLALFAANEPGVWYDPSDLTTLFTDPAGTTPVTTPGQTVGLMLDKSKGLALGAELAPSATINGVAIGGPAFTTYTSAPVVSGKFYRAQATVTNYAGTGNLGITGTGVTINVPSDNGARSGNGVISFGFFAASTGNVVFFSRDTNTAVFTNISVRELPGNHATQSTLASRPIYGIEPAGGRRNLLVQTEDLSQSVWAKNGTTSTASSLTFTGGAIDRAFQTLSSPTSIGAAQTTVTMKATFSAADVGKVVSFGIWTSTLDGISTGRSPDLTVSAAGVASYTWSSGVAGLSIAAIICRSGGGSYTVTLAGGVQLEWGSTATAYQKVTSQYDVTEAGVASTSYLAFDGVDDGMITNSIDFTATDKMSVFAGVRKIGEVNAALVELSADASANNGAFTILAPGNFSSGPPHNNYTAYLRGTAATGIHAAPYTPPITNVVTFSYDIAAASALTEIVPRVNGETPPSVTVSGFTSASAGLGNFGNYPLYIGRRGGSSFPLNGRNYGIVVVGKATTAAEITSTENWLAGKTGISL